MPNFEQRDYQDRIHKKAVDYLNVPSKGIAKTVLIESPTGSGKTVMALRLAKHLEDQGHKVGFIAHRKELLQQAERTNKDFFGCKTLTPISLFNRDPEQFKDRTVVIVDEAQHDASKSASILHDVIRPDIIIGLTATPYRTDKVQLCFQKVIRDAGIHQLIREGYLAEFTQWVMDDEWTPQNVARIYMEQPEEWGKSVIYFLTSEMALECNQLLLNAGVRSACILGSTKDRDQILDRFRDDELSVITNVAVLTEGFDCLDMNTEILTDKGWKRFTQIDNNMKIYALNKADQLELVPIEACRKRKVRPEERFVTFKSQHLDIRVTEGHNFYIKYRDPQQNGKLSNTTLIKTAANMAKRRSAYGLPLSAELDSGFKGVPISDDDIKLIGWFMTDGWFRKNYVCIGQSKEHRIKEIRDLLIRMGLDFIERIRINRKNTFSKTPKSHHVFMIPKGTGKGKNKRNGWISLSPYLDKNVSPLLHNMTRHQFHIFWEESMKGDGARKGNRAGWLWCERKIQADTYTHMAIIRGFASSCRPFETKYGKTIWRVTVRDKKWIVSDPTDKRSTKIEFEPSTDEEVWCVQNRLGTIVTRRNGKTAIIGNCPSLKTAFVRPSSKGPTVQMAGRAFRKFEGLPIINIVQNGETKFPFTRHARAYNQMIRTNGKWENINPKNLQPIFQAQRTKVANAKIEMPDYIKKRIKKNQIMVTG